MEGKSPTEGSAAGPRSVGRGGAESLCTATTKRRQGATATARERTICDCASRCPVPRRPLFAAHVTHLTVPASHTAQLRRCHDADAASGDASPYPVESAQAAGLRYVSDTMPGIQRKRAGTGFTYVDTDGQQITDKQEIARIRVARDPSRVHRRLDLPPPQRAHPGHRPGRPRAEAVPLPPALAGGPGRDQVRPDARLQPWCCRRSGKRVASDLAQPRAPPGEGARHGGAAARVHRDPGRERRVRQGQPLLRSHHAAGPPRGDLGLEAHASSSGGRAGRSTSVVLTDRRLARIVARCQALPGETLFQYEDETAGGRPSTRAT